MSYVKRFSHLVKLKHSDRAKAMLEKVASLVKPLMKSHSWTLPMLSEMLPGNPNLLGLNVGGGQKILLRLRPHHAQDTFLELDDVVGTMLHELTHNVHGPHDAKFYALLAKLTDEYDALVRGGWSGDGFHSDGVRVGKGTSHDVPRHVAKEKAVLAAEKRRQMEGLMAGSGRALGRGAATSTMVNKSARELAAEAAERRIRDDSVCGSARSVEIQDKEEARADRDGIIDLNFDDEDVDVDLSPLGRRHDQSSDDDEIEVLGETSPLSKRPSTSQRGQASSSSSLSSLPSASSSLFSRPRPPAVLPRAPPKPVHRPPTATHPRPSSSAGPSSSASNVASTPAVYACSACTFENPLSALKCTVCESPRPLLTSAQKARLESLGWYCNACGREGIGREWWCCTTVGCPGVRGWS